MEQLVSAGSSNDVTSHSQAPAVPCQQPGQKRSVLFKVEMELGTNGGKNVSYCRKCNSSESTRMKFGFLFRAGHLGPSATRAGNLERKAGKIKKRTQHPNGCSKMLPASGNQHSSLGWCPHAAVSSMGWIKPRQKEHTKLPSTVSHCWPTWINLVFSD